MRWSEEVRRGGGVRGGGFVRRLGGGEEVRRWGKEVRQGGEASR